MMTYVKLALAVIALLLAVWQRGTPVFYYWILVSIYWDLNAIDGIRGSKK